MPRIKLPKAPESIALYYTVPLDSLTAEDIHRMRVDFALAAHEQYHPTLRLEISPRTDFVGLTAEDVLRSLEAEHNSSSGRMPNFMLVTSDTVESAHEPGREIEVVYVDKWAFLDEFTADGVVESARSARDERGTLDFAKKLRIVLF